MVPVAVNEGLDDIDDRESEIDEWWEVDPDIWGARGGGGGGAYPYGRTGWVVYEGVGAAVGAVALSCGRVELRRGGGGAGWGGVYSWDVFVL
jgi:hypothetical protein